MNTRKVLLMSLLSNLIWLSLLAVVFTLAQTAQANGGNSPASSTGAPTIGPYYQVYSGADFRAYRFDFDISRDGYAVVRNGSFGIGVVGLHLPPGAAITAA